MIVDGVPPTLLSEMDNDLDFTANSRRVRLKALGNYINSVIRFLETKVYRNTERIIFPCPDVSKLTNTVNGLNLELKRAIERRWDEAQRCMHTDCHLSAIILIWKHFRSIVAQPSTDRWNRSSIVCKGPAGPENKQRPANTTLESFLTYRCRSDLKWIKADRAKFSHILRESRNMVHPYEEARNQPAFDGGSSKTCWQFVNAAVDDVLA
jgi:hypothetical protein